MIEAHGVGGQADLPIPLSLAVGGASAALVVSFIVLATAWRSSRYQGAEAPAGHPLPSLASGLILSAGLRIVLRVAGMALFLLAAASALFGQSSLTNPFFGMVYVWWWVGLPFASVLFGPVWKAISPVRTLHAGLVRATGGDPARGVYEYPARLGLWPAALGLFAFVWLELVYDNSSQLGDVRLWCVTYFAIMLVGGAVFGSVFYDKADPFEVFSTLAARLSPWKVEQTEPAEHSVQPEQAMQTKQSGPPGARVVLCSPLANLAATPATAGLTAVVAVLFGSTAFDSFGKSEWWLRSIYDSSLSANVLNNIALIGFCAGAGIVFAAGCMLTRTTNDLRRRALPDLFAHSLIPIIVAYFIAHYLTLFVDYGLQTLALTSDPFGEGWNLFGTAGIAPTFWFSYHPTFLATLKVLAVVVGHVAAAIAAHDRALQVLPAGHRITGQLPLLITMVGFTAGGLMLLFSA